MGEKKEKNKEKKEKMTYPDEKEKKRVKNDEKWNIPQESWEMCGSLIKTNNIIAIFFWFLKITY